MPSCGHKSPNKAPLFVIYSKYRSPQLLTQQLTFCIERVLVIRHVFSHDIFRWLNLTRSEERRGTKSPKVYLVAVVMIDASWAQYCVCPRPILWSGSGVMWSAEVWVKGAGKNSDQTQTSPGHTHRASSGSFWIWDKTNTGDWRYTCHKNSPDTKPHALLCKAK